MSEDDGHERMALNESESCLCLGNKVKHMHVKDGRREELLSSPRH